MRNDTDRKFLRIAYEEAKAGFDEGGCPIGSVLARGEWWFRKDAISGSSRVIRSRMAKWMRCARPAAGSPIGTRRYTRH